ncbi:MAG TPA: hypothetical protein VF759_13005 [Allosphingosinicella sp.]|jgi:hypothetical protein
MKTAAFAIALLAGSAAFAQVGVTAESQAWEGDGAFTTVFETEGTSGGPYRDPFATPGVGTIVASADSAAAAGGLVRPSNSDPERDARGIAVISAAAMAPAGWNGTAAGSATGGPELDPATGEAVAADSYPACTATVTDRCLQTYERGRR